MGLAAGQARLLSITARKSDCEFQSMRLSHQKIALARELADLSNQYQNSLTQTKLVYDYYGTGDTSTPLTYGLMMSPSALNDYMPIMLTSSDGRVVLNSKLAAAAVAAGIPQEGLGTLPSEELRNRFIWALSGDDVGIMSKDLAGRITGLPYNQGIGFGGGATVAAQTQEVTLSDFATKYLSGCVYNYEKQSLEVLDEDGKKQTQFITMFKGENHGDANSSFGGSITLTDLVLGGDDKEYHLDYSGPKGECSPIAGVLMMQDILSGEFVDFLSDSFSNYLVYDGFSQSAFDYAVNKTYSLITDPDNTRSDLDYETVRSEWQHDVKNAGDSYDEKTQYGDEGHSDVGTSNSQGLGRVHAKDLLNPVGTFYEGENKEEKQSGMGNGKIDNNVFKKSNQYMGFVFKAENKTGNKQGCASINLNNLVTAFLTYYADYMNGLAATDEYGAEVYEVSVGACENGVANCPNRNKLVNDSTVLTIKVGKDISSDDLGQAAFYDAMFNQICAHGWIENDEINDKEYLKQMLQSGKMFLLRMKEDDYYYQGNYATDSYIKEIQDESAIAYSESKYNTEKAKLNSKEETIDLKMKNLDTEISSLTTEYDTVKNTISKNIEKSFKRYSA